MTGTSRRGTLVLLAGAFVVAACAWQSPPSASSSVVLESFDVFTDGDALLVPVEVRGKRFLFGLDTGSTHTVYDTTLHELLGERAMATSFLTPDGAITVDLFQPPPAKLGAMDISIGSLIVTSDLRKARQGCGHDFYGLLGMDFLKTKVIRFDPDRGKVEFLRAPDKEPGTAVPLTFLDNWPCVNVQFAGWDLPELCTVDTGCIGAGSGTLRTSLLKRLEERKAGFKVGEVRSGCLSGEQSRPEYRIAALTLAGLEQKDVHFSAAENMNALGLAYLSRYVITFDFPGGKMYLQKAARFDAPDRRSLSGLKLSRIDGRTVVDWIDKGSVGEASGCQVRDELLVVGGKKTAELRLHQVRLLLSQESKVLPLRVRRGDQELTLSVKLPDRDAGVPDSARGK